VKTGNSVKLTIDSEFQKQVQQILADGIDWLHHSSETVANPRYQRGQHTEGGAIAVLDVRNGKVLALANYPSYDINDYIENYSEVLNAENQPLFNRVTMGLYRPGSTFKTITGFSGLINGVIDVNSTVVCNHIYTFYKDYQPHCTGTHGSINILNALKVSCNIFFYDVGRRTGIEKFSDTAARIGIGQNLGLETGGASGKMTTPEVFKKATGNEFSGGDVLQAAIGQSETLLTPLHLAVQAMTFANDGVRYKPYLVDSVWNYDGTEKLSETKPVVADEYATDQKNAYAIIREGMTRVPQMAVWPPDNMNLWIFDYLPDTPAFKTGTPEAGADGKLNSAIMGYYPAHNPVIAYGIVLENSDFSRYLVRNIIDAYFYNAYEPDVRSDGIIKSPWKRWDTDKQARMLTQARNYAG
jgi:penicillin-binding protein 2